MHDKTQFSRPERTFPQELELALIQEGTIRRRILLRGHGYEGLEDDPRPLPQTTLGDLCAIKNEVRGDSGLTPGVLWFAFYSNKVAHEEDVSIPVSPEDLLWLCAPEDTVLLSDFRADHYCGIDRIIDERIYLSDQWPDLMPIKSVHRDGGLLFIEREAFLDDAVGLLTLDTPQLVDSFFKHRPDLISDYEIVFAFGNCILLRDSPNLSWSAAGLLGEAVYLAHKGNSSRFPMMVARNYLALVEAEASKGRSPFPENLEGKLTGLLRNWPIDAIEDHLDSSSLLRAATANIKLGAMDMARRHVDFVIRAGPENDEALSVRATINLIEGYLGKAIKDAEDGLKANQELSVTLKKEITSLQERDWSNRALLEMRLGKIEGRSSKLQEILERVILSLKETPGR